LVGPHERGLAQPLLAEFEGRPIAAVILVRFADRVIYMYGASRDEARERMPNHLLQWEAIRWARAQGAKVYDFWGAPDVFDESDRLWGVWRFKAGFNGEVVRFIGAWDYTSRPLLYRLYTQAIPRYLDLLRSRRGRASGKCRVKKRYDPQIRQIEEELTPRRKGSKALRRILFFLALFAPLASLRELLKICPICPICG
jgi:hypothetical protein